MREGDILLIEAESNALSKALVGLGLTLEGDVKSATRQAGKPRAALTAGGVSWSR